MPSAALTNMNNLPLASARSPTKMASGGLKSAKNADTVKFTFLPIKDSMDKALLDEID